MIIVSTSLKPSKEDRKEAKAISLLFSAKYVRRPRDFDKLLRRFTFFRACLLFYKKSGKWSLFKKEGSFLREIMNLEVSVVSFPKIKKRDLEQAFLTIPGFKEPKTPFQRVIEYHLKQFFPYEVREPIKVDGTTYIRDSLSLSLSIIEKVVEDGDVFGAVHKV